MLFRSPMISCRYGMRRFVSIMACTHNKQHAAWRTDGCLRSLARCEDAVAPTPMTLTPSPASEHHVKRPHRGRAYSELARAATRRESDPPVRS